MDEQVQIQVEQQIRSSHRHLAVTDDEINGEEEEQLPTTRRAQVTSGELRSADTTAIKKVLWPHELILMPKGQPAAYKNLLAMPFVNGYLTKMAVHLHEMMEDGENFGWSVVRAAYAV